MTELEKLQRAKAYLEKLAEGIDPLSDLEMPGDGLLNQVRLSRCFFYVAGVLGQVVSNGGRVGAVRPEDMAEFSLSGAQREAFAFSREPVPVSRFTQMLNDAVDQAVTKKLPAGTVTGWLLEKGFLAETAGPGSRKSKKPTPQGERIGLSWQTRQGLRGEYDVTLYSEAAQHFLLDNLDSVLEYNRGRRQKTDGA